MVISIEPKDAVQKWLPLGATQPPTTTFARVAWTTRTMSQGVVHAQWLRWMAVNGRTRWCPAADLSHLKRVWKNMSIWRAITVDVFKKFSNTQGNPRLRWRKSTFSVCGLPGKVTLTGFSIAFWYHCHRSWKETLLHFASLPDSWHRNEWRKELVRLWELDKVLINLKLQKTYLSTKTWWQSIGPNHQPLLTNHPPPTIL